ncbi:hypothetical protein [Chitinophaga filiformis]|uniref:Uncharacterized protein n=1 Tax=Chitinophaga filiformis TaxID=104663 RepID=A0ABY4I3J5_CHIFI|nr:hypothetical protein [Chitinophaga filiformis]UPK70435.1 hypothetical protein MYF79_03895 [Chitinophaga filiformis]
MKRIIGIFLLALMCTQLLPIKEMGRLLFNNQIVEEHPVEDGGCCDLIKLGKELKFLHNDNTLQFAPSLLIKSLHYNFFAEIPQGPTREIHCPPPNC